MWQRTYAPLIRAAVAAKHELVTQWKARTLAMDTRMAKTLKRLERSTTLHGRARPSRRARLDLTLDNTLEEYCRLAFMHVTELYDADGNLKPLSEWPKSQMQAALQLLGLKRQALKDILEYLRHAGVYGSPAPPPPPLGNTLNSSVTVVPLERLTDEELEFYRVLAKKGRAIPIDASKP
jgi:hypothetical protein